MCGFVDYVDHTSCGAVFEQCAVAASVRSPVQQAQHGRAAPERRRHHDARARGGRNRPHHVRTQTSRTQEVPEDTIPPHPQDDSQLSSQRRSNLANCDVTNVEVVISERWQTRNEVDERVGAEGLDQGSSQTAASHPHAHSSNDSTQY